MKLTTFLLLFSFVIIGLTCTKESVTNNSNDTGVSGSLSQFTISGNYLYVVNNYYLTTFDISDPGNVQKKDMQYVGINVETIYPYKDKLFIGSSDGLYIYSISDPISPIRIGTASHARSCDPVVSNDSIAFVTLRGNTRCGPAKDGLYIHNINNILHPTLINTLFIATPSGLGLQDSMLYVCCQGNGLRVYNVKNPTSPIERNICYYSSNNQLKNSNR